LGPRNAICKRKLQPTASPVRGYFPGEEGSQQVELNYRPTDYESDTPNKAQSMTTDYNKRIKRLNEILYRHLLLKTAVCYWKVAFFWPIDLDGYISKRTRRRSMPHSLCGNATEEPRISRRKVMMPSLLSFNSIFFYLACVNPIGLSGFFLQHRIIV